ncbi:MAG: hypothetical protein WCE45_07245 [Sedimentisphaerales bacterium]
MTQTARHKGIAFIITMIILAIIAVLALSLAAISSTNIQVTQNNHKTNSALCAAESGIEYAKYLAADVNIKSTADNEISISDACDTWNSLYQYLQNCNYGGVSINHSDSNEITTNPINFGSDASFWLQFFRYDTEPNKIGIRSTGTDGAMTRTIEMELQITKKADVLQYSIASQTRMWLTGNSTIHGNIYSSWKYQNISPFNITSDSTVEGTIGTILSKFNPATGQPGPDLYAGTTKMPYHLETLDANGNPVYDVQGDKVISPTDEIQGHCQGIIYDVNYGNKAADMPGMKITDYDTSQYKSQTTVIPSSYYTSTVTEYAPPSGGLKLTRYVCENKTLTNAMVAAKKNALFKNCTFNGILYVDGGTSTNSNNIRFENCVFNGPIVTKPSTDTSSGWWQRNQLYFTGEETFQNQTDIPITILAPNFNVDIGNTNPTKSDDNVLTGAIVGGIVDIRGNAEIYGTVISMFDTSGYSSGYVSNIGATLGDGGSETTNPGDVGVINITPDKSKLLPSGVTSPIVIKPLQDTYREINN